MTTFSKADVSIVKESQPFHIDTILTIEKPGDTPYRILAVDLHEAYVNIFNYQLSKISPVINETISNLLRNRDFLGYQLDYQSGNISEDDFSKIIEEYLPINDNKIDLNHLKNNIKLLMDISNRAYNADELSIMLNCEINDAEKALTALLSD